MTTSRLSRAVSTFALSFPVVVWASDCVGSVYTVKGKSMEPSLQDGDIVLVRKADILQLFNHFSVTPFDFEAKAIQDRILRTEGRQSRILSRPPLVLPGDVVVFANPMKGAFPRELNIKRVVAVGNMMVGRASQVVVFIYVYLRRMGFVVSSPSLYTYIFLTLQNVLCDNEGTPRGSLSEHSYRASIQHVARGR